MDFKIPETGEELREFLADQKKVGAVFSATAVNDGTAKKFLDAHAAIRNKKDAELQAQQREQMQIVLAEFLRDSGAQAGPPVGLSASGRPPSLLVGLALDGVSPNRDEVLNGRYEYYHSYWLYVKICVTEAVPV